MPVMLSSLEPLVATLRDDGYRVVGPTVRDNAIVLAQIESATALPYGWGVTLEPVGIDITEEARALNAEAHGPAAGTHPKE
jgi:hypothetical protein